VWPAVNELGWRSSIDNGRCVQSCDHRIEVMPFPRVLWFIPVVFSSCLLFAQRSGSASNITPTREMARLAEVLVGDWNNVETMEPSAQFPKGADVVVARTVDWAQAEPPSSARAVPMAPLANSITSS
jgi:hypothetical protein